MIAALGGTLCHEGGSGPLAPDAPAPARGADCMLCPVCVAAGPTGMLPVAAVALPVPETVRRFQWAIATPPRAPPAIPLIAAQPRGPPILI